MPTTRSLPNRFVALTALALLAAPAAATDYYVDDDAPPGGNGLTWATAFNSLDDAITAQLQEGSPTSSVHVAQGAYIPQGGHQLYYTGQYFLLYNAYGGYVGYDAPDPNLRDPDAFPTILSGDVNADDTPDFQNLADNLPRVVAFDRAVDGFVITGAAGSLDVYEGNGAGGDTHISNCRFHHNSGALGGALTIEGGSVYIENCVFENNRALWDGVNGSETGVGGAVYVLSGAPRFHACRFSHNHALIGGAVGTFFDQSSSGLFSSCIFTANEASDPTGWCTGGALGLFTTPGASYAIENCLFYGNTTTGLGGAVFMGNPRADYRNCVFWNNSDAYGSGTTAQINVPPTPASTSLRQRITNIVQGAPLVPPADGPLMFGATPTFIDPLGPDGILGTDDDDFRPAYGSPAIDAGGNDGFNAYTADFRGLPRSVDDPATPNAVYTSFTGLTDLGPYEYQEDCDDNGTVDSLDIMNGTLDDCDHDGVPDVCQPEADCNGNGENDRCDIGSGYSQDCNGNGIPDECDIDSGFSNDDNHNGTPDECEPATLYVDASPGTRGPGLAWPGSYASLHDALAEAAARHAPTEIWVAEGTYTPAGPGGLASASFHVPAHTTLLGGFDGTETSADQRDPGAHPTVLSGDLDANDNPNDPASFDDNARTVVTLGSADGSILDALTIKGGYARVPAGPGVLVFLYATDDPNQPDITVVRAPGDSGAVRASDGVITLRNCRITQNRATVNSVIDSADHAVLTLDACTIDDNHTTMAGSEVIGHNDFQLPYALYANLPGYPADLSPITLIDSVLTNNSHLDPTSHGDLIGVFVTPLRIERTLITANTFFQIVRSFMSVTTTALETDTRILNSAIVGNDGLALVVDRVGFNIALRQLVMRNSTVAGNNGGLDANHVFGDVQNSIIYANGDPDVEQVLKYSPSLVRYNTLEHWNPGNNDGANIVGNTPDDPMFIDPLGPDATPYTGDENFRLMPGSTSIDSGDSAAAPAGPALDLDNNLRFVDDPGAPNTGPPAPFPPVDRGAYERQIPHNFLPADINGDGTVNVLDFAILARNFQTMNTPGVPGDINEDDNVDVLDFAILASSWAQPAATE